MARRLRLEFSHAVYHILNRGNYRRDLFLSAGEAQAFVSALEEAVACQGWVLHAYVIMRNHYHLALETPDPNLVSGMHWLQSTFATRFNRFRRERGHLFQGRYQALVIEDQAALARVVDYIHLNPVRVGLVEAGQVAAFRWSSLGRLIRGRAFPGMTGEFWLAHHGLKPNASGWKAYQDHLVALAADPAQQDKLEFSRMSSGWAIGTHGWRQAIAKEHAAKALNPGLPAGELKALRATLWEKAVARELTAAGKDDAALARERKFAPWKVKLAAKLRTEGIPSKWLAQRLHLGSPDSARVYLSKMARGQRLE